MGASLVAPAVAACRGGAAVQVTGRVSLSGGAEECRRESEQHSRTEKSPRTARWAERATHEWSMHWVARKNRWLERPKFFVTRVIGLGGVTMRRVRKERFLDRIGGGSNTGLDDQSGSD